MLRIVKQHPFLSALVLCVILGPVLIGVSVRAWRKTILKGNESAATRTLDVIRLLEADYQIGHKGQYGTFDQLIKDGALDDRYKGGAPGVNGYVFTLKIAPKSTNAQGFYSVNADPVVSEGSGATGRRHFYLDPDVDGIRVNEETGATASDPKLAE